MCSIKYIDIRCDIMKRVAIVFPYSKDNRNSYNALGGAIEINPELVEFDIYYVYERTNLVSFLQNIIRKYETVVLGISICTPQTMIIQNMIKELKVIFKDRIFFVAGGPHATGAPQETLNIGFDVIVIGEGEETFPDLLNGIKYKQTKALENIRGLAYYDCNEKYEYTGKRKLINLDDYPPFPVKAKKFGGQRTDSN